MHTSTRALMGLALTAAVGLAGGAATASTAGHPPVTMHFVAAEEPGNFAMADLGPASAPGEEDIADVIAFTETLTAGGVPVGQVHLAGIGVDHVRMLTQSTGTISLPDGTVEIAGVVPKAPTFSLAVTGGTGRYAGAEGTLALDFTGDQPRLTLSLQAG